MFLHLGGETIVPLKNVISITDMKMGRSMINGDFIKWMGSEKKICDISEGSPKSFVVTDDTVYLSAISSLTLKKRSNPEYLNTVGSSEE